MDCYNLLGFIEIMRESIKVPSKNGKLIAFITTLYLIIYSLFFLLNIFSTKPLFHDLSLKAMELISSTPNSPQYNNLLLCIKEDAGILLGAESAFVIICLIISLFANSAIILVSAISYSGKKISSKELVMRVMRFFPRPLVTLFYVMLLSTGYALLCYMIIIVGGLTVSHNPVASKSILVVFGILVSIFYVHLSVVWMLGIVVSVMEESCCGIKALGKAGELIQGKRVHGFILNFVFNLVSVIIYLIFRVITAKLQLLPRNQIFMGLFMIWFTCIVTIFQFMAFTVLYIQCKKNHGEEIEVQGSMEYSKIPSTPLVHEDIP